MLAAKKIRSRTFYSLVIIFFLITSTLSGCIRLTGKAGYWHKGKEDEYAKSKQVGFDTQKFVPGSTPGNIKMGES
jgi:hypothetical protein